MRLPRLRPRLRLVSARNDVVLLFRVLLGQSQGVCRPHNDMEKRYSGPSAGVLIFCYNNIVVLTHNAETIILALLLHIRKYFSLTERQMALILKCALRLTAHLGLSWRPISAPPTGRQFFY